MSDDEVGGVVHKAALAAHGSQRYVPVYRGHVGYFGPEGRLNVELEERRLDSTENQKHT